MNNDEAIEAIRERQRARNPVMRSKDWKNYFKAAPGRAQRRELADRMRNEHYRALRDAAKASDNHETKHEDTE